MSSASHPHPTHLDDDQARVIDPVCGPNILFLFSPWAAVWAQFVLGTPVVLWAGWPFFV